MSVIGKGMAIEWIRQHLNYQSDFCLVFPFYRDPNGYGMMGYNGKSYYAHRLMCELANGPPPNYIVDTTGPRCRLLVAVAAGRWRARQPGLALGGYLIAGFRPRSCQRSWGALWRTWKP